jgi:hypothetical protein
MAGRSIEDERHLPHQERRRKRPGPRACCTRGPENSTKYLRTNRQDCLHTSAAARCGDRRPQKTLAFLGRQRGQRPWRALST